MRVVRHKKDAGHVLFRYPYFSSLSDCDEKIVCLSERSIAIILNALEYSDKMRTRVYTEAEEDLYTTVEDEEWGNFQYWVSTVRTELGSWAVCNEYLERIAVALEAANQAADEQTLNLKDVFEAMGIETSETEADILEALEYLLSIPGIDILPNFKVPKLGFISSFMEGRYRAAHLQLLRDQAISMRGMAVAQGGVDFAALYDTMGETADSLLVKAGYAGKAYWIWRWIDNDQIPGWAGWVTTISGLLLGSIRGGIYDIVSILEGWLFPDYTEAIEGIQLSCTSSFHLPSCGCGSDSTGANGPGTAGPGDVPPETVPGTGYPSSFPDQPTYDTYKCKAANVLVLNLAEALYQLGQKKNGDYSQYTTYLSFQQAMMLQNVQMLYTAGMTGPTVLAVWLTEKLLTFLWPQPGPNKDDLQIFEDIRLEYLDEREEAVCDLFNASHTAGARDAIETRIDEYIDATAYSSDTKVTAKEMYKALLTNAFLNGLFTRSSSIANYTDSSAIVCADCEGFSYEVTQGEALSAPNANPIQIELIPRVGCTNGWQTTIVFSNPFKLTDISDLSGYGKCLSGKIGFYPNFDTSGGDLGFYDEVPDPDLYLSANTLYINVTSATQPTITVTFEWSYEA